MHVRFGVHSIVRTITNSITQKKRRRSVGILRRLCFPVTVLTTATVNREQEVMLSSPVSLAPREPEQSKCHELVDPHSGYVGQRFWRLRRSGEGTLEALITNPRVKST